MALDTPGERRIGGKYSETCFFIFFVFWGGAFYSRGSKLLRSNMHWGCKLLRGALYSMTDLNCLYVYMCPLITQKMQETLTNMTAENIMFVNNIKASGNKLFLVAYFRTSN